MVDKNMGQSFISNLETGEREETPFIAELANALGVNAYWLKTGKGERISGTALSQDEQTILEAYRLFDRRRKDEWMYVAKTEIAEHESNHIKGRVISLADYRRQTI